MLRWRNPLPMIRRSWPADGLLDGCFLGPMGGAPTIGFNMDQIQLVQNVTAIVEMIRGAVDPISWDGRGGQGSLGVNLQTMSLIVRQLSEARSASASCESPAARRRRRRTAPKSSGIVTGSGPAGRTNG